MVKRGQIVLVNLNPIKGAEQGNIRPALVIQNDLGNKYSPTTIIAPITSKNFIKKFPTNVLISPKESGLNKDSTILLNQIRTIDKSRIIKTYKKLNDYILNEVNYAIKKSLDLD